MTENCFCMSNGGFFGLAEFKWFHFMQNKLVFFKTRNLVIHTSFPLFQTSSGFYRVKVQVVRDTDERNAHPKPQCNLY